MFLSTAPADLLVLLPLDSASFVYGPLSAMCAARPSLSFVRGDGSSMVTAVWVLQVLSLCSCARDAADAVSDKI
jgi:hypothetical protein